MITKPLDLQSRLSSPPRDLDFAAWVNVGVIALFFGLFGSRFILAPGETVETGDRSNFHLPSGVSATTAAEAASVVVTYKRDDVILFEGGIYSLATLKKHFEDESYVKKHPGAVVLFRGDRQVSIQAFLDLCEMTRSLGFARVIVAAEPTRNAEAFTSPTK